MPKSDAEVKAAIEKLAELMTTTDDDETPGCWAVIITATAAFGLLFPIAYLRGWVALKLWQWFAAPVWPGVHLTIYVMVGLMFLLQSFRNHSEFKVDADSNHSSLSKAWANLIASVCYPFVLLGMAWLWTWLAWGQ